MNDMDGCEMSADPPRSRYARRVHLIPFTALPYPLFDALSPYSCPRIVYSLLRPPIELALTCTVGAVTATCSLRAPARHLLPVDLPVIRAELVK